MTKLANHPVRSSGALIEQYISVWFEFDDFDRGGKSVRCGRGLRSVPVGEVSPDQLT